MASGSVALWREASCSIGGMWKSIIGPLVASWQRLSSHGSIGCLAVASVFLRQCRSSRGSVGHPEVASVILRQHRSSRSSIVGSCSLLQRLRQGQQHGRGDDGNSGIGEERGKCKVRLIFSEQKRCVRVFLCILLIFLTYQRQNKFYNFLKIHY